MSRKRTQVPREVKDRNSKAWNGGHIYISSEEVAEAYLKQYFTDFAAYLKARADELVHGGGLPMALLARHSPEPIKQDGIGSFIRQMELPLKDMLQQVKISPGNSNDKAIIVTQAFPLPQNITLEWMDLCGRE
eukprot:TRINITY_DN1899_c0_g1_i8.p1 TRINITY_DN1899_c0_g1~~TRINITY_DN1899_c0_g1_i8.p1  ORF type:complete len:133 (-),score=15.65 TRINITY_DN1899_c0_g1_i8:513-911(-)